MSSRRQYLTIADLEQYADVTVSDDTEAEDQISMAEEILDAFVGGQERFFSYPAEGIASGGTTTTLVDTRSNSPLVNQHQDYFKGCEIEFISGSLDGKRVVITGSTAAGTLTFAAQTAAPGSCAYRITQVGKFPRYKDIIHDTTTAGAERYYKSIPDAVRRATAAQVEFMIEKGASYFSGNDSDMQSESIGNYSYSRFDGVGGLKSLIAPKARALLRGITNRTGRIIV